MKRVLAAAVVMLTLSAPAFAATELAFTAPVVDAAKVVPDDVEQRVNQELLDYQQRSGNQIAVAVITTIGNRSLEDFSIDLAREWGVGTKGDDNGVLLLIVYKDRKLRIEVGRGLEGELTDLESGRIISEQIVPRLRTEDVGGAVENGTLAIRSALGDTSAAPPPAPSAPAPQQSPEWVNTVMLLGFVAAAGLWQVTRRSRRRHVLHRGGQMAARRRWDGSSLATLAWLAGSSRGGGFGGSGGGSGGGFSGGGGGGFGGGGASGSW